MNIIVENLGKKFRNEWIFRGFNQQFLGGQSHAIIGPNGSGKSTLLQVISSYIPFNEGVIKYSDVQSKPIEIENIYQYISFTSPLLELIEDFSLLELIDFHIKLKPLANQIGSSEFIDSLGLQSHQNKQIKFFSSGMKQKVKLGLCLFSNSPILFLDEPTTNLDLKTKEWFLENIQLKTQGKLIIIASNDPFEYSFSKNIINIQDFK